MAHPFLKKLEQRIVRLSDQDFAVRLFSLEGLVTAASFLYKAGATLRLRLYQKNMFRQKRLDCPVISIGNMVAGGTGKTPMAVYLARLFLAMGKKPVVISRGYKGCLKEGFGIVGDGKDLLMDADAAGDEPFMMAAQKAFPVVVGKDRYQAGLAAVKRFNPDVIILDDGFQHVRLRRDLDILLFDHDRPLGNNRILPAGRLREPLETAAGRAGAVVLTRCPEHPAGRTFSDSPDRQAISQAFRSKPLFRTFHSPYLAQWVSAEGNHQKNLADLKGKQAVLWSGIAQNSSFSTTVENLGCRVAAHLEFSDHYRYTPSDIEMIREQLAKTGARLLVTTEKDWARMNFQTRWPCDLAVIGIQLRFDQEQAFKGFIRDFSLSLQRERRFE